jgi:chorismate mutase
VLVDDFQALSKRIHYGKFVAEAKFQAQTLDYTELIHAGDAEGINSLLTDRAVELKVDSPFTIDGFRLGLDEPCSIKCIARVTIRGSC